jgi:hypothetical protein
MHKKLVLFPTPYPDELLYSIFARYHLRSCNKTFRDTMKDLFGSPNVTAMVEFPLRLGTLIKRLPSQNLLNSMKLIQEHSMLPYYKPFIPPELTDAVVSQMVGGDKGIKSCPVIGQSCRTIQRLRYCPKCIVSDEMEYGEPYWHRSHQVYGVRRCHRHDAWLVDSTVTVGTHGERYSLFALGPEVFSGGPKITESREIGHQDWLAKAIHWLLNGNHDDTPPPPKILLERYRKALEKMEYMDRNGVINTRKLKNHFLEYYSADFLESLCCSLDKEATSCWLIRLFQLFSLANHPLYHLLVIRFLGSDYRDILNGENESNEPFGRAPWPCLNRAAQHYLQPVVTECSVARNNRTSVVTGTFKCECGFVYERFGPDTSPVDRTSINKIVTTGALWDQELVRLVSNGIRLEAIGSRLGVNPAAVVRHFSRLVQKATGNPFVDDLLLKRNLKRSKWRELCARFPDARLAFLKERDKALFSWLNNNDIEWFRENSPKSVRTPRRAHVDWEKRDNELASQIVPTARTLRQDTRMVTKHAIGRALGVIPLLQKYLDKLPKTKVALASAVETAEDSAIRRFKVAVADFQRRGDPLWKSYLLNAAKINFDIATRVASDIDRILLEAKSKQPFLSPAETLLPKNRIDFVVDGFKLHEPEI